MKKNIGNFAAKMDRLGVLAFLYVIVYSILSLRREGDLLTWILLIVGVGGLAVDLFIVIKSK